MNSPVLLGPDGKPVVKEPESKTRTFEELSRLGDRLKGAAVLASLTSVVVYALLRTAYVLFFGRLGVEPEDVGLGKTEILVQSIVGLVAYALFLCILIALMFVGYWLLGVLFPALGILVARIIRLRGRPGWALLAFVTVLLVSAFFVVGPPTFSIPSFPILRLLPFLAAFFFLTGLSWGMLTPPELTNWKGFRDDMKFARTGLPFQWMSIETGRKALPWPLFMVLFLVFFVPALDARDAAGDVMKGRSVKRSYLFNTVPLLNIEALRAQVWWIGEDAPPPTIADDCLLRLGESRGQTVFWDFNEAQVVRVISNKIGLIATKPVDCPRNDASPGTAVRLSSWPNESEVEATVVRIKELPTVEVSDSDNGISTPGGTEVAARFVEVDFVLRNVGETSFKENLLESVSIVDTRGRGFQPKVVMNSDRDQTENRVVLKPGELWSGTVGAELHGDSKARHVDLTLNSGLGPESSRWTTDPSDLPQPNV